MPLADIPGWIASHGPVPIPAEPGPRLLRTLGAHPEVTIVQQRREA
jgi:hypothetical protein